MITDATCTMLVPEVVEIKRLGRTCHRVLLGNLSQASNHTRFRMDVLKWRTRCARYGVIGHWAKVCKNPPDERGRAAAAARTTASSTQPSSAPSTASVRWGFFVEASEAGNDASQGFRMYVCMHACM